MWRRERPAIAWRAIYRELKRLEFRGEVRRGYFVRGLSGAQFALPEAVEMLRDVASSEDATPVVMSGDRSGERLHAADAAAIRRATRSCGRGVAARCS